eukprot:10175669-Heterocapsa_arctica.AAC.1
MATARARERARRVCAGWRPDGNQHGRIAMLAAMGRITKKITGKLPGYLSPSVGLKFADVPSDLAAIPKVPATGWGQKPAYWPPCETSQEQSPGTADSKGTASPRDLGGQAERV